MARGIHGTQGIHGMARVGHLELPEVPLRQRLLGLIEVALLALLHPGQFVLDEQLLAVSEFPSS